MHTVHARLPDYSPVETNNGQSNLTLSGSAASSMYLPRRDGRLSCPRRLVRQQHGLPLRRQSPVTANILLWGKESRRGSAMVPLDRALLSSYWLSAVSSALSVTLGCNLKANCDWGFDPKYSFPWETGASV